MKLKFAKILVVDHDAQFLAACTRGFGRARQVMTTDDPDTALRFAHAAEPHLAVVDLWLADANGIDLIGRLRPRHRAMTILLMSGYLSPQLAIAAVRAGADNIVEKPAGCAEILRIASASPDEESHRARARGAPRLRQAQDDHVRRVLADCGGNISQAALVLGVRRQSLQRMLRRIARSHRQAPRSR